MPPCTHTAQPAQQFCSLPLASLIHSLSCLVGIQHLGGRYSSHPYPAPRPLSPCCSFWVQLLTFLADKVGLNVYADTESGAGRSFAWLYYLICSLFARLGISSK